MAAPKLKYSIGNAASTTGSSSITNTDTAVPLTSDTNFSAKTGEGMVIVDEGAATEELAYSTGKSGASLTTPLANRGLEGGSPQAHSGSYSVKGVLTAGMWNDLIDSLLNILTQSTGAVDTTKIADVATNQTLTGTKTFDKEFVAKQLATPSSPSSGYNKLYFKNDDKLYKLTSGGTETEVGATSGGDWTSYTAVTPTSGTLDDPSFEFTFAGVDLSTTIYPGMRLKVTQGTVKYFIVTKVAFSTNTTITAYGGTDYDLVSTGTTAITAFSYSSAKAPAGFPMSPDKWMVEVTDTTLRQQLTPTSGTWYNPGSVLISIPIGIWNVNYQALIKGIATSGGAYINAFSTLSTANNTESNANMTMGGAIFSATNEQKAFKHGVYKSDVIDVSSKTSHYLNIKTTVASSSGIEFCNDEQKLIIQAICAYL